MPLRLSDCNIIDKPLHKSDVPYFLVQYMKDVFIPNVLSCPLLCAVTSSIYIIITTFTFVLRLLITSQIVSILITIIIAIIIIIIIIITIIIIKINPPFSLSKLVKLCLSLQPLRSQDLNQLSKFRRNEMISNIFEYLVYVGQNNTLDL